MLSVFKTAYKNIVKFHNDDVRLGTPYDGDDNPSGSDAIDTIIKINNGDVMDDIITGKKYIGEVFYDNTVFLKFYTGRYILYYEDKDGNILTNSDPIVLMEYEWDTPVGDDSYNEDFTDEVFQ